MVACQCHSLSRLICLYCALPSVLWCCWLDDTKGIQHVKYWVVGCWCGYLSGARCTADLHMAQPMPLPLTVSCFSKIHIGFTFLVPAHPVGPRERADERGVLFILCIVCLMCWLTNHLSHRHPTTRSFTQMHTRVEHRYSMIWCFNVHWKADTSRLYLPHGTENQTVKKKN